MVPASSVWVGSPTMCTTEPTLSIRIDSQYDGVMPEKVLTNTQLAPILDQARAQKKRIVFTNGCFDLMHIGHTRYLQATKQLGDLLVVGINSDASVRRSPSRFVACRYRVCPMCMRSKQPLVKTIRFFCARA